MNRFFAGAAAFVLACGASGYGEATGSCAQGLETPLHDRGMLTIQSAPSGLQIVGTDQDKLRVTCTRTSDPHAVRFLLTGEPGHEQLTIRSEGEHQDNLEIRVEVPHRTSLRVHIPAGQVKVNDIRGDKNIDLYAGQITIAAGDTSDYRSVQASVDIGEVKASAWGVDKGGFFRSFTHTAAGGEYRLYAHVLTGQIDLQ
jgi:hypothetical protein